jgi:RNA polymerase sigma factor (sigma-70 family)
MKPSALKSQNTRSIRLARYTDPRVLDTLTAAYGAWQESSEEVETGLEWGRRKARLLRWVRLQMGHRLTPRERQCVELHFFEARKLAEVSAELGIKRTSVARALRRSIQKLRQAAAEDTSWQKKARRRKYLENRS